MQNATIAGTQHERAGTALEDYCIVAKIYLDILNALSISYSLKVCRNYTPSSDS
jgi:hypothetical protein